MLDLMYIYSKPKKDPFSIKQPNRVPKGKQLKFLDLIKNRVNTVKVPIPQGHVPQGLGVYMYFDK